MRDKTPIREQVARRKPAAPQRVNPLTLGDLAAGGVKHIEAECDWCRHEGRIALAPLLAKAGPDALYREVARHFLCSACGWRGINAWPVWPGGRGRPKAAGKAPGLPSLDECRAALAAVQVDPRAQLIQKRGAYLGALRQRWPELTASQALFVVQTLRPWESRKA